MKPMMLCVTFVSLLFLAGCSDDTASLPQDLSPDQIRALEDRDRSVEDEERAHRGEMK